MSQAADTAIALITKLICRPSPMQAKVIHFVVDGRGSAIVDAVAGAGKTKTLEMILLALPEDCEVTLVAFNTAIAAELNARIDNLRKLTGRAFANATAATFHSLGNAILRRGLRGYKGRADNYKIRNLIERTFTPAERELYGNFCAKLVDFARCEGIGAIAEDTADAWQALVNHHGLYLESEDAREDRGIELARRLLTDSNVAANNGVIDFADMLYIPLLRNMTFSRKAFVLGDESQDTNPVRRAFLRRMLCPKSGRLIAVGDPNQSIFGFTGASHDAMELIAADFRTVTLPLSVCYRCSKAVVRHAAEIVPHIAASETAPEGKAGVALSQADLLATLTATDAILCRNTAPLVSLAYSIIARGKGCRILGRDIGYGLAKLVKAQKAKTLASLDSKLEMLISRAKENAAETKSDSKLAALTDKVDCIRAIIENLPGNSGVADLLRAIDSMFTDDDKSPLLTLSTIHKAKGKEWPQVALLRPELLPSKYARQAHEQQQERNLDYVWRTRAQVNSYYLAA